MIAIAFRRVLSSLVANWRVLGKEQGLADRGWQGKRPAVDPADVVGWIGQFTTTANDLASRSAKYPNEIKLHRAVAEQQGAFSP